MRNITIKVNAVTDISR